jgi:hypothetical protein
MFISVILYNAHLGQIILQKRKCRNSGMKQSAFGKRLSQQQQPAQRQSKNTLKAY